MSETPQWLINNFHKTKNNSKNIASWCGFLEGVMSCNDITFEELEALKQKTMLFVSKYSGDDRSIIGDAKDLIENFLCDWDNLPQIQSEYVNDFLQIRIQEIVLEESYNSRNLLNGFLSGIATDGVITIKEANSALEKLKKFESISKDPPYSELMEIIDFYLSDGVIDQEESLELCEHIGRIVGNSFSDTGLVEPADIQSKHDFLKEWNLPLSIGKTFLMTGNFKKTINLFPTHIKRSAIEKVLIENGMIKAPAVSKTLGFLFISNDLSPNYATETAGTKILKARALIKDGVPIQLVSENLLWKEIDKFI